MSYVNGLAQNPSPPFGVPTPIVYERATGRPSYEYHSVTIDLGEDEPLDEIALGALGSDGWLLASVTRVERERGSARLTYYFVRPA